MFFGYFGKTAPDFLGHSTIYPQLSVSPYVTALAVCVVEVSCVSFIVKYTSNDTVDAVY